MDNYEYTEDNYLEANKLLRNLKGHLGTLRHADQLLSQYNTPKANQYYTDARDNTLSAWLDLNTAMFRLGIATEHTTRTIRTMAEKYQQGPQEEQE